MNRLTLNEYLKTKVPSKAKTFKIYHDSERKYNTSDTPQEQYDNADRLAESTYKDDVEYWTKHYKKYAHISRKRVSTVQYKTNNSEFFDMANNHLDDQKNDVPEKPERDLSKLQKKAKKQESCKIPNETNKRSQENQKSSSK